MQGHPQQVRPPELQNFPLPVIPLQLLNSILPLNYPIRLNNKLAAISGVVASSDAAPTDQSYAVYQDVVSKIDAQLQKLDAIIRTDLPAFNKLVRDQDVPAVFVKSKPKDR